MAYLLISRAMVTQQGSDTAQRVRKHPTYSTRAVRLQWAESTSGTLACAQPQCQVFTT
jgi:hypothetical protein